MTTHRSNDTADVVRDESRPASRRETLAAVLVIFCALLLRTPCPEYALTDPDGGVQLAVALQILRFDEHPWIDYGVAYGPLPYYLSTAFQWASGGRLIGELLLDVLAYLVGFVWLFRASRRLAGRSVVPWFWLLSSLILLPRFFKYFIVVAPAAVVAAAFFYIASPRRGRIVTAGVALGGAFLARADLGIIGAVAMATAVATVPGITRRTRHAHMAAMASVSVLVVVPWLTLVVTRGHSLVTLARDVVTTLTSVPAGLALPHPLVSWHDPVLTATYTGFFGLAGVTSLLTLVRWRSLPSRWRSMMAVTMVIAAGALMLASHRSDLSHIIQATPLVLLLGTGLRTLFAANSSESANWRQDVVPAASIILTTLIAASAIARTDPSSTLRFGSLDPRDAIRTYRLAARPRSELVETVALHNPDYWPTSVIGHVRWYSSTDDRVCIWPWHSQLLYFADRGFAGRTPYLLSGHLDSQDAQQQIIAALGSDPPAMIVWDESFTLDDQPQRNPTLTHSEVYAEVVSSMDRVGSVGQFSVYLQPARRSIESVQRRREEER